MKQRAGRQQSNELPRDSAGQYILLNEDSNIPDSRLADQLAALQRQCFFGVLIFNLIWLLVLFSLDLQGSQQRLTINYSCPNPPAGSAVCSQNVAGIFFLGTVLITLIVQIFCMLVHRGYTLMHFLSSVAPSLIFSKAPLRPFSHVEPTELQMKTFVYSDADESASIESE